MVASFPHATMPMHLRPILVACLFLSACVSMQEWEIFSDRAVNITFAYDPAYVRDGEVTQESISFNEREIPVSAIALRKGDGEMSFINIMQTKDPTILAYLLSGTMMSERVTLIDTDTQVFRQEGMGDPIHYLFQKNDLYIVLSFVFPPSQADRDRVLNSVVLR